MSPVSVFLWVSPVGMKVIALQRPFCHSVPKTERPNQSSDVRRNPIRFNGCRFTVLNAISECFTSMGAFNEDALAFSLGCEGSLWCGWGLFLLFGGRRSCHSCLRLSSALGYKCLWDILQIRWPDFSVWCGVLQNASYHAKINLENLRSCKFAKMYKQQRYNFICEFDGTVASTCFVLSSSRPTS